MLPDAAPAVNATRTALVIVETRPCHRTG